MYMFCNFSSELTSSWAALDCALFRCHYYRSLMNLLAAHLNYRGSHD